MPLMYQRMFLSLKSSLLQKHMLQLLDSRKSYVQLMKRLDQVTNLPQFAIFLAFRGSLLTNAWDPDSPFGENTWTKQKRNTCIFRVSQLKQARLKSEQKQKWDRLQVLPLSLDKNIREYLSERYALITAKRFYFFRYIVFSGMVCGGYFETVVDSHSLYLRHFLHIWL